MKYSINAIAPDHHVRDGVKGGFTQPEHGRRSHIDRLESDDYVEYHSPNTSTHHGQAVRSLLAVVQLSTILM